MNRRLQRINGLLRDELSHLVAQELQDPRLAPLVTITRVDTSPDLTHAKVLVSVLGDPPEQKATLIGLNAAAGFLWRELRHHLSLRIVPQLRFLQDDSIQRGQETLALMNQLAKPGEPHQETNR